MYRVTGQIVALKNTAPTSNERLGHLFYSEVFFDNFMSLTQKDDDLKEEFCQLLTYISEVLDSPILSQNSILYEVPSKIKRHQYLYN